MWGDFPVREKLGNFEQTGEVREKSHKILENSFQTICGDLLKDITGEIAISQMFFDWFFYFSFVQ